MAEQSGGSPDHSGVAGVVVKLPKVDRSEFEKNLIKELQEGGGFEAENGMWRLKSDHPRWRRSQ
jgi:hypothetical protein